MRSRQAVERSVLLVVLGAVLLGSIAYLLVLSLGGAEMVSVTTGARGNLVTIHNPRIWLIAAAAAAVLAILHLVRAERRLTRLADLTGSEAAARRAEEEARRRYQEAERERDQLRAALSRERGQHQDLVAAWRSQREWNSELRSQIIRLQRTHGVLGRHDDVREMVLDLTMSLVDAEKGILLSQRDSDEGRLEVVCHHGFDHDPQDSALAQRFAEAVIARDSTIREDDETRMSAEKSTPADEEVRNLLAIPIYLIDDFAGVIVCANREGGFAGLDDEVLVAVGDHAGAVLQNSRLHGDLRAAYLSTIGVLADAIELKDPELRGHSDAVSEYVLAVADRLGFEPRRREELIFASLLHDVGKLGISERILLKPAALTDEERSVIQLHPRIGYHLVCQVPPLKDIAPAVLHHHERFDGEGYPGRLRGDAIPLEARIISIADSFSAITSDRPYRPARTVEEACAELERCAGDQFDPEVVRLFVEEVRRRPPDEQVSEPLTAAPEFESHRVDGEYKLGARSFGITDSLTLLYSHRHFHETARAEAQRAAVQGRPFAVLVVALQDLTEVNRERGFGAGDALLQTVAGTAQQVAASCQGMAFRASGRRIAVIAPGADQTTAEGLATAWTAGLRSDRGPGPDAELIVTAAAWREGEDGEQVIERARAAVPSAP